MIDTGGIKGQGAHFERILLNMAKLSDFPIGSRIKMVGAESGSDWKVVSHILDESGQIVRVEISRANQSLSGMSQKLPAGNENFVLASSVEEEADAEYVTETPKVEIPKEPKMLSTTEISDRTGLTKKDILSEIAAGNLPAQKQRGMYFATVSDVDAWAKSYRAAAIENKKAPKEATKKVKASVIDITGEKTGPDFSGRGKHLKVPIRDIATGHIKADPRNPFQVGSRLYGFFNAFIEKNGEGVSYDDMLKSYMKMRDALGMDSDNDNQSAIERDLSNHISAWQAADKVGPRGLHLHIVRLDDHTGRISKGQKGQIKYRLIGFKPDSPYAEKAKAMGWKV